MSKAPMPQKAQKKTGGTPTAIKGTDWISQLRKAKAGKDAFAPLAPEKPKK